MYDFLRAYLVVSRNIFGLTRETKRAYLYRICGPRNIGSERSTRASIASRPANCREEAGSSPDPSKKGTVRRVVWRSWCMLGVLIPCGSFPRPCKSSVHSLGCVCAATSFDSLMSSRIVHSSTYNTRVPEIAWSGASLPPARISCAVSAASCALYPEFPRCLGPTSQMRRATQTTSEASQAVRKEAAELLVNARAQVGEVI